MKNLTLLLISIVLITSSVAIIYAISTSQTGQDLDIQDDQPGTGTSPPPSLSTSIETEIKQDYLDLRTKLMNPGATIDDIAVDHYYGTYNGTAVVIMTDAFARYLTVLTSETVGGATFHYPNSNKALAWNDGSFYSLQEAYSIGLLTENDLREMAR